MTLSLFGCAAFFIFTILFATPVKAVTISQINLELVARPGETIEQLVQLYDESFEGTTVYPAVYNFTADPDNEGSARVLTDPAELKTDRFWVKWDTVEITGANTDRDANEVTTEDADEEEVDAEETADEAVSQGTGQENIALTLPVEGTLFDFPYRIEVPNDAEPGTHLISLVFQSKPQFEDPDEGAVVYVGSNVAVNIFLKVLGATIDDIDVTFKSGNYANKDSQLSVSERKKYFEPKNFFLKPPVDFLITVDNKGNTHQKPGGNIKIVNDLFGGTPEIIAVNAENKIILPGTDRTFEVSSFGQGFMFGKYRAKIELLYGDPLKPVDEEIAFWIVPLVEILIALAVIILIIVIIIIIRKYRKKKRAKNEKEKEDKMRQQIIDELKGKKGKPGDKGQSKEEKHPKKKGNNKKSNK